MDAADLVRAVLPAFEPPPEVTGSQWAELHRRAPLSSPSRGAAWPRPRTAVDMRILLVEDETTLREQLKRRLEQRGYSVDAVADGRIPRDHAAVVATDRPFLVYESDGGFAVAAGTSSAR